MTMDALERTSRRALVFTPMENNRQLLVEAAVHAEERGYGAVVIPEAWGLDATIVLAEIAQQTERIRLVAGILSVWGRTPATLAMTAATLDDLSGGRFVLGLGASTPVLAERLHGTRFVGSANRLAATVATVRSLLRGERTTGFSGQPGLALGRDPRPDIPIWVAGLGPRAARVATTMADAWFPVMIPRSCIEEVRGSTAGPEESWELVTGPMVAMADDEHRARSTIEQLVAWYLCGMGRLYGDYVARSGHSEAVDALRAVNPKPRMGTMTWPEEANGLLEELAVFGDSPNVADQLRRWDERVDLLTVVTGPSSTANIHQLIDACSPDTHLATSSATTGPSGTGDS